MAITGPNIGTSAFAETGQRAMSAARVAVRLAVYAGSIKRNDWSLA